MRRASAIQMTSSLAPLARGPTRSRRRACPFLVNAHALRRVVRTLIIRAQAVGPFVADTKCATARYATRHVAICVCVSAHAARCRRTAHALPTTSVFTTPSSLAPMRIASVYRRSLRPRRKSPHSPTMLFRAFRAPPFLNTCRVNTCRLVPTSSSTALPDIQNSMALWLRCWLLSHQPPAPGLVIESFSQPRTRKCTSSHVTCSWRRLTWIRTLALTSDLLMLSSQGFSPFLFLARGGVRPRLPSSHLARHPQALKITHT